MRSTFLFVLLIAASLGAQSVSSGHSAPGPEVSLPGLLPNLFELEPLANDPGGNAFFVRHDHIEPETEVLVRSARAEYVVLRETGPGLAVRIQSARRRGRLRIYVDDATGSRPPFIDEDVDALLRGQVPWALAPFATTLAGVGEMQLPIPFAKSLLVTVDHPGAQLIMTGRRFPKGTVVRSATRAELKEYGPEIERLARVMLDHQRFHLPMIHDFQKGDHVLPPGTSVTVFEKRVPAPQAVSWLSFESAELAPDLLRGVVLKGTFDGTTTVAVPLGDFHGKWEKGVSYQSTPVGTDARGLLCSRWVMPMKKSVRIELVNTLKREFRVNVGIGTRPLRRGETAFLFHARWARSKATADGQLVNALRVPGEGTFAGMALLPHMPTRWPWTDGEFSLWAGDRAVVQTSLSHWMGFPDTSVPFASQLRGSPGTERKGVLGRSLAYRWLTLEAIPFSGDLTVNVGMTAADPGASLSSVFCWYGTPVAVQMPKAAELVVSEPLVTAPDRKIAGALEIESLLEAARTGGPAEVKAWRGASADEVLQWIATEDHFLDLAFTVAKAGTYRVALMARPAALGGPLRVAVDGDPVGVLDGGPGEGDRVLRFQRTLGAGAHRLRVRRPPDGTQIAVTVLLDAMTLTPVR